MFLVLFFSQDTYRTPISQKMEGVKTKESSKPATPNPKTIAWERLENMRLKRLGLENKYSRHFNVLRQNQENCPSGVITDSPPRYDITGSPQSIALALRRAKGPPSDNVPEATSADVPDGAHRSTMAPFSTSGKPTCGYFFSDVTDNRKRKFGIPPSDLVKWRNFNTSRAEPSLASKN